MRQQFLPTTLLIFFCFTFLPGHAQCDASFNSSNTTVCSGNVVNFVNASTGNTTNSWKINEVEFSTAVNSSFMFPSAGTFTAELVISNGMGCVDSVSTVITVNQTPVINVNVSSSSLWTSDSVLVSFTTSGVLPGATYYWDFCDGNFWPDASPFYYQWATPGTTYCVCAELENLNGCSDADCEINIVVNDDLGWSEPGTDGVRIYPNPSPGNLVVELRNAENEFKTITITDQLGRVIKSYTTTGKSILFVEAGDLVPGMYVIKISGRSGDIVRQIVIE